MSNLHEIWTRRASKLVNYNRGGTPPKSGFDFDQPIAGISPYQSDNYRDLAIIDLREILDDIVHGIHPEQLSYERFSLRCGQDMWSNNILLGSTPKNPIKIISSYINDQAQFTIYLPQYGVFSISWYKNRGRIDSIINTEYGQPANLEDITMILIALELEEDTSYEWDATQSFNVK